MSDASIDVLGLGYTAVDELLYVDAHPAADAKIPSAAASGSAAG